MATSYKSDLISMVEQARTHFPECGEYPFKITDPNVIPVNGDNVFYIASNHFYLILAESWRAVLENKIEGFEQLLKSVWDSKELQKNGLSFRYNLHKTFDEFKELAKEQFFYFKNISSDKKYRFPLYSLIEDNGDVTGGFFHFLIKHFEKFSSIHSSSNDQTGHWPNELLYILMKTSIYGQEVEKKDANQENDYELAKEMICHYTDRNSGLTKAQKFRIALYYDSKVDLHSVNTFHRV